MNGKFWDKGIQLVDGCDKVSPGCRHCWAETMTKRFKRVPEVLTNDCFNGKVKFNLHFLERDLKMRKPQVFAIWNDLFHKKITDEQVLKVFDLIRRYNGIRKRKYPLHTILIVTKRPERAADFVKRLWVKASGELFLLDHSNVNAINIAESTMKKFWPNVWHIVTTENQLCLEHRLPSLLKIPGKRGLIIEPMLDKIDLRLEEYKYWECPKCGDFVIDKSLANISCLCGIGNFELVNDIHQVILGAESGTEARPMNPEWARSVRDQCQAAGIPFYLKSLGPGKGRILDGRTHDDLVWVKK